MECFTDFNEDCEAMSSEYGELCSIVKNWLWKEKVFIIEVHIFSNFIEL